MQGKRTTTTKYFNKQFRKLSPKLQRLFVVRLQLFLDNPFNEQLRTHKLSGKYEGRGSFNVTGDIRVIFDDEVDAHVLVLVAIGSHSELYG